VLRSHGQQKLVLLCRAMVKVLAAPGAPWHNS
jgi:hypothetical protein